MRRDNKSAATAEWHKVHEEAVAQKAKALRRTTLAQQAAELEKQNDGLKEAMKQLAASRQPLEAKKRELLQCVLEQQMYGTSCYDSRHKTLGLRPTGVTFAGAGIPTALLVLLLLFGGWLDLLSTAVVRCCGMLDNAKARAMAQGARHEAGSRTAARGRCGSAPAGAGQQLAPARQPAVSGGGLRAGRRRQGAC